MKQDGTSGAGWNDCRQNRRETRKATLSRSQRVVRPFMKDAMAPDGRGARRGGVEVIL